MILNSNINEEILQIGDPLVKPTKIMVSFGYFEGSPSEVPIGTDGKRFNSAGSASSPEELRCFCASRFWQWHCVTTVDF